MMSRWPLHPPPYPHESLSSWLERLAAAYGYHSDDVLLHDLGFPDCSSADLDWSPPSLLVERLAERSGMAVEHISTMTIQGWRAFLLEDVPPGSDRYATYVHGQVVLYPRSLHRVDAVGNWFPWLDANRFSRGALACRSCLHEGPAPYRRLSWRMAWMTSCPVHSLLLEDSVVMGGRIFGEPVAAPSPAPPEILTLDRLTQCALEDGTVSLPGGQISGSRWLRLLRTLLDELSQPATARKGYRTTIPKIWRSLGLGTRQGLGNGYTPFERLNDRRQQILMRAAGATVALFQQKVLTRCGEDAVFFLPPHIVEHGPPERKQTRAEKRDAAYAHAWRKVHTAMHEVETAMHDDRKTASVIRTFLMGVNPTPAHREDIDRLFREQGYLLPEDVI